MERSISQTTKEGLRYDPQDRSRLKRVCVQWPRFGPYHLARLTATYKYFQQHGVEVIGLETASRDDTYAWRIEQRPSPFRRIQIFPDQNLEDLTPAHIYNGVTAILDHLDPDAVAINSYSFPDALACLAWCRSHQRTAVVMSESKGDDALRVAWRERLKAFLLSHFDAALLGGTPQRAYFERLGFPREAITLGYDVVDNAFFDERARQARQHPEAYGHLPGLASEVPFFLAVSRLIPRKNIDGLLRAYKHYRTQAPSPWGLIILGDGPERARLEHLVTTEHLEGVTLAGFRQREDIAVYYGLASTFVHPARVDPWGLVVNEAMAAGLPVLVSTQTGCAQNLIDEGENGFCFDADDTRQCTHLMGEIASPGTDRAAMGRRSQTIIARWSPDRFARMLWWAVRTGRQRAQRPYSLTLRFLLWAYRRTARHVRSFHVIKD